MQITIDVPEIACTRCAATAPVQPQLAYSKSRIPAQFRETLSAVMKERSDVKAVDNEGRVWEVLADEKPVGWMKGPSSSDLCESCGALWIEEGKMFLTSAPPPVVEEPVVVPVPKSIYRQPAPVRR